MSKKTVSGAVHALLGAIYIKIIKSCVFSAKVFSA